MPTYSEKWVKKESAAISERLREHQKPGFQSLLREIEAEIVPGMTLATALQEILTFSDRFSIEFGNNPVVSAQALTAFQCALLEVAPSAILQKLTSGGQDKRATYFRRKNSVPSTSDACTWFLGIWSYGRVWLARECPCDPECRLLGTVSIPVILADAVVERARLIQQSWMRCDRELDAFYCHRDAAEIERILNEVHELVDHIDPVLFYIGDATLTNFGKFNNLQERYADLPQCFHRRAVLMPPNQWTYEERVYVFCVYWLRVAGCRGEEFNGRQLNAALLDHYLDSRLAEYRQWAAWARDTLLFSIGDKARMLARCKLECAEDTLTYRVINGVNFHKEERVCSATRVRKGMEALSTKLRAQLCERFGVNPAQHDSLRSFFDACVMHMARSGFVVDGDHFNPVEAVLKMIVDASIEATGSDVGMTRGTRDLLRLQQAFADRRYGEICAWPAGDYFCAVFPSRHFLAKMADQPGQLAKILMACSSRMQFNHWHYMPGHCPRDSVPADRHFYFPPCVPDIASWSDLHHAGHVLAEVRYSIRAPAPIEFNGNRYPGMIDLRLFRRTGHPYSEQDLLEALAYTELLRAFHQSVSDHVAKSGTQVRINAFDKAWFQHYCTGLFEPCFGKRNEPA